MAIVVLLVEEVALGSRDKMQSCLCLATTQGPFVT